VLVIQIFITHGPQLQNYRYKEDLKELMRGFTST